MKKKQYISPKTEVILLPLGENILAGLSVPVSSGDAGDGGDAKGNIFDDNDESENIVKVEYKVWED